MKSAIAFCLFSLAVLAYARPGEDRYTDRYDNINVKEITSNKRLLVPYIKCLLEQDKCTAEGKELKDNVKDALENECSKCTEAQKSGTQHVIGHLINHEPKYWQELSAKYDPENKYASKYEDQLRKVKA